MTLSQKKKIVVIKEVIKLKEFFLIYTILTRVNLFINRKATWPKKKTNEEATIHLFHGNIINK